MSFGLFGLAGGVTNWVAVYMLFEKVPYLYGSGVIPVRYVEIRSVQDSNPSPPPLIKVRRHRQYKRKPILIVEGGVQSVSSTL